MDYRYLKAFLLTATHKSFSKAAEELSVAQSAVSRQIKLLEENLGLELIIRSSKKVLLTQKGRELYLTIKKFDEECKLILDREDRHPLRIGILHGLLKTWFNPLLVAYSKKYDRNMKIHIADTTELIEGMEQGRFDAIFSVQSVQSDLLSSLKILDENFVLISKEEVNKKKLHEYKWIVFSEGDNLYKVSSKKSERIISVDSISTIIKLVKSGVGIAVVPDHVLKKSDKLQVQQLPSLSGSEVFMTTLNYKMAPNRIKELYEVVKSS